MRSEKNEDNRRDGFTLVELMVVFAVIGVLLAVLLPAVQQVRAIAGRASCQNQLRQLGLGLHNYHETHRILPPGALVLGPNYTVKFSGWGWGAIMLPQIDQGPLHSQLNFNLGTAVDGNELLLQEPIAVWKCPSDFGLDQILVTVGAYPPTEVSVGNYGGSTGLIGPLSAVRFNNVTDGLSQTLMIGERVTQPLTTANPPYTASWCGIVSKRDAYVFYSLPYTAAVASYPINSHMGGTQNFSSRHNGGANFAFGDGAVKFLSENMDVNTFEALGTPAGGEIIEE